MTSLKYLLIHCDPNWLTLRQKNKKVNARYFAKLCGVPAI